MHPPHALLQPGHAYGPGRVGRKKRMALRAAARIATKGEDDTGNKGTVDGRDLDISESEAMDVLQRARKGHAVRLTELAQFASTHPQVH